jgi:fructose-bisphosphate aldolase class II
MTARDAALDQTLIAALRDAVPVPLVLHGASGVSDDELRAAVAHGIVKINIGTALNVAYTAAVRDALHAHTAAVDPRGYLATARTAVSDTVSGTLRMLAPAAVPR